MAENWTYAKRQLCCSDCERTFQEGEEVYSMMRIVEDELQRVDLCRASFDDRDASQDVVYWRTSHREKGGAMKVDFDMLLAVLEKLADDQRDERLDLRYLLTLLLVRHRKLRLERVESKKGVEFLILRKVRTKTTFKVESRELEEERRKRLSAVLAGLLDPTSEGGIDSGEAT
ncbi:MAG: hypothetical protein GY747_10915 [Planctomycetes bacterium]|nr:hypothetical protein [Planctomycetota bacterium]MCP4772140.1 hypothetical protein [Planctomycetota bacterium]MCP4861399.1 hypothetical protein [Planctomycetota bacterium]